jgi:hypothetical protein
MASTKYTYQRTRCSEGGIDILFFIQTVNFGV